MERHGDVLVDVAPDGRTIGVEFTRCPECGRVFGFDVTADELGLTNEQLQRAQAKRIQRRTSGR